MAFFFNIYSNVFFSPRGLSQQDAHMPVAGGGVVGAGCKSSSRFSLVTALPCKPGNADATLRNNARKKAKESIINNQSKIENRNKVATPLILKPALALVS